MKNVLYVEDEYIVCVAMKKTWEVLKRTEDLHISYNYEDAISFIKGNEVDLLITDISLPDRSGSELIEEIRKMDKSFPIVVLSNYNKQANKASHLVQDHVQKPFYTKDVERILEKYL